MKQLLSELFDTYYKDIYTYLYSLCRDASLAEDLTSEVFLEVVRSIATFRGESEVRTWLFTIARRRWFAYLKQKQRQIPTESIHELYDSSLPKSSDAGSDVDAADMIRTFLQHEPELNRKVMELRLEGYSYFEIGKICGISENSARVIFFRTKAKIKKLLEQEGFHYE